MVADRRAREEGGGGAGRALKRTLRASCAAARPSFRRRNSACFAADWRESSSAPLTTSARRRSAAWRETCGEQRGEWSEMREGGAVGGCRAGGAGHRWWVRARNSDVPALTTARSQGRRSLTGRNGASSAPRREATLCARVPRSQRRCAPHRAPHQLVPRKLPAGVAVQMSLLSRLRSIWAARSDGVGRNRQRWSRWASIHSSELVS